MMYIVSKSSRWGNTLNQGRLIDPVNLMYCSFVGIVVSFLGQLLHSHKYHQNYPSSFMYAAGLKNWMWIVLEYSRKLVSTNSASLAFSLAFSLASFLFIREGKIRRQLFSGIWLGWYDISVFCYSLHIVWMKASLHLYIFSGGTKCICTWVPLLYTWNCIYVRSILQYSTSQYSIPSMDYWWPTLYRLCPSADLLSVCDFLEQFTIYLYYHPLELEFAIPVSQYVLMLFL